MEISSVYFDQTSSVFAEQLSPIQFEEKDQQEIENQYILKELQELGYIDIGEIVKGRYAIWNPRRGPHSDGYVYHTQARHPEAKHPYRKDRPIQMEILVHREAKDGPFPTKFEIFYIHWLGGW